MSEPGDAAPRARGETRLVIGPERTTAARAAAYLRAHGRRYSACYARSPPNHSITRVSPRPHTAHTARHTRVPDVVGEVLEIGAVPRGLDGGEDAGLLGACDVVVPGHAEPVAVDGVVAGLDLLRGALQVGQVRTVAALVNDRIRRPRHQLRQQHLLALQNKIISI